MFSRRGLTSNATRRRRKERFKHRFIFTGIFALVILVGVVSLSHLGSVRIAEITVSGNSLTSAEEVRRTAEEIISGNYFFVLPKNNIFFYPKGAIEAKLLERPVIESVKVSFENFKTISITFVERTPKALWCSEVCYFISSNGFIFSEAMSTSTVDESFVRFGGGVVGNPIGSSLASPAEIQKTFSFIGALREILSLEVVSITLEEGGIRKGALKNKTELIWNNSQDLNLALQNLKLLIESPDFKKEKNIEYIDIQNSNKIFFKPR